MKKLILILITILAILSLNFGIVVIIEAKHLVILIIGCGLTILSIFAVADLIVKLAKK